jgi:hypothetical protein
LIEILAVTVRPTEARQTHRRAPELRLDNREK